MSDHGDERERSERAEKSAAMALEHNLDLWAERVRAKQHDPALAGDGKPVTIKPTQDATPKPVHRNRDLDKVRDGRPREVSGHTLNVKQVRTLVRREDGLYPEQPGRDYARPKRRGECENGGPNAERPCPFVSCAHHLYLDVDTNGSIKLNFPDLEVWEMAESCVLDVADMGGVALNVAGGHMNLTRERIRQLEVFALRRIDRHRRAGLLRDLAEFDEGPPPKRLPVYRPEDDDERGEDADHEEEGDDDADE